MNKLFFLPSVISFAVFCSVGAQEQNREIKKITVSDFNVQTGFFFIKSAGGVMQDFKTLAPNSELLNMNFSDYTSSSGFLISGSTLFAASLGLKFADKQRSTYKKNPQLRCGIAYANTGIVGGGYFKEERKPYDTLVSSQSGQATYIDSITTKNVNVNYTSEQLRLDASLIFRTNEEKRWSLYTGIGVSAGWAINAYTNVSYFTIRRTQETNSSNSYSDMGKTDYVSEHFQNKSGGGFSTYIPLGVDFRIGKKREFWQHLHLYYEIKPSMNAAIVPELKTFINAGVQEGLGIRYTLN